MEGHQIGSYVIERKLGEGGMGVVWVGVDVRLGRRAAVKQLLPELSGQHEVVERFFNEARAAAGIDHPGIVEIYDVGWHTDGSAYFAMKLLDGESLAARLRRAGPMPPALAAAILRQIGGALVAAHARGIVHRDLKPDNVVLVPDDEVAIGQRAKLLDFGIAKLFGAGPLAHRTRTGNVMGTPFYMSPEQCRGAGEVDHRADIYALGCIAFELLTGRPPFVAEGAGELLGMHQFIEPPTVRSLRPDVDPGLEAVVMRALAKRPEQRFASMAELVAALQAFVPGPRSFEQRAQLPPAATPADTPSAPAAPPAAPPPTTLAAASGVAVDRPPPSPRARRRWIPIAAVAAIGAGAAIIAIALTGGSPRAGAVADAGVDAPDVRAPVARYRFDGSTANRGRGPSELRLLNTEQREGALYLDGRYSPTGADGGPLVDCTTPALDRDLYTVIVRVRVEPSVEDRPLVVGGRNRWLVVNRTPAGKLAIALNNYRVQHELPGVAIADRAWTVVAVAVDVSGGIVRGYVDGRLVGEGALPAGFAPDPDPARTDGRWTFTDLARGHAFHGLVSDLVVYDRLLTPDELAAGLPR